MQACVAELNQSNDTVEKFVAHSNFLKSAILGGNKAKHKCVELRKITLQVRLSLCLPPLCLPSTVRP